MKTLLVGYDLNRSGQHYEDVWTYLKGLGTWWHHLDSTWIVRTEMTPVELRDKLRGIGVDANDELLIIDITGDAAAWSGFSTTASEWLKSHL